VRIGDLVRIDWDGHHMELTFVREREGALVSTGTAEEAAAAAALAEDGLGKDTPTEAVAGEIVARPALPATTPGVARQPLQSRKKE